jgi:hypothetical protein
MRSPSAILANFPSGPASGAPLEDPVRDPPPWTRLWCFWFWVDGDVTEDGVTKPKY